MKKMLLFFMFVIAMQLIFAQDWQLVSLHQKYNYQQGNDTHKFITHVLWVDSVKTSGNDSIFYLNRFLKTCKQCQDTIYDKLYDQPLFLQKEIIKKASGIFICRDTQTFVFQTLANLNESWLFDSLRNIQAQVIKADTQNIWGILDSVKNNRLI